MKTSILALAAIASLVTVATGSAAEPLASVGESSAVRCGPQVTVEAVQECINTLVDWTETTVEPVRDFVFDDVLCGTTCPLAFDDFA